MAGLYCIFLSVLIICAIVSSENSNNPSTVDYFRKENDICDYCKETDQRIICKKCIERQKMLNVKKMAENNLIKRHSLDNSYKQFRTKQRAPRNMFANIQEFKEEDTVKLLKGAKRSNLLLIHRPIKGSNLKYTKNISESGKLNIRDIRAISKTVDYKLNLNNGQTHWSDVSLGHIHDKISKNKLIRKRDHLKHNTTEEQYAQRNHRKLKVNKLKKYADRNKMLIRKQIPKHKKVEMNKIRHRSSQKVPKKKFFRSPNFKNLKVKNRFELLAKNIFSNLTNPNNSRIKRCADGSCEMSAFPNEVLKRPLSHGSYSMSNNGQCMCFCHKRNNNDEKTDRPANDKYSDLNNSLMTGYRMTQTDVPEMSTTELNAFPQPTDRISNGIQPDLNMIDDKNQVRNQNPLDPKSKASIFDEFKNRDITKFEIKDPESLDQVEKKNQKIYSGIYKNKNNAQHNESDNPSSDPNSQITLKSSYNQSDPRRLYNIKTKLEEKTNKSRETSNSNQNKKSKVRPITKYIEHITENSKLKGPNEKHANKVTVRAGNNLSENNKKKITNLKNRFKNLRIKIQPKTLKERIADRKLKNKQPILKKKGITKSLKMQNNRSEEKYDKNYNTIDSKIKYQKNNTNLNKRLEQNHDIQNGTKENVNGFNVSNKNEHFVTENPKKIRLSPKEENRPEILKGKNLLMKYKKNKNRETNTMKTIKYFTPKYSSKYKSKMLTKKLKNKNNFSDTKLTENKNAFEKKNDYKNEMRDATKYVLLPKQNKYSNSNGRKDIDVLQNLKKSPSVKLPLQTEKVSLPHDWLKIKHQFLHPKSLIHNRINHPASNLKRKIPKISVPNNIAKSRADMRKLQLLGKQKKQDKLLGFSKPDEKIINKEPNKNLNLGKIIKDNFLEFMESGKKGLEVLGKEIENSGKPLKQKESELVQSENENTKDTIVPSTSSDKFYYTTREPTVTEYPSNSIKNKKKIDNDIKEAIDDERRKQKNNDKELRDVTIGTSFNTDSGIDSKNNVIYQNSTQLLRDVYFIANGVKFPILVIKNEDETFDLALDSNKMCPKCNCPNTAQYVENHVNMNSENSNCENKYENPTDNTELNNFANGNNIGIKNPSNGNKMLKILEGANWSTLKDVENIIKNPTSRNKADLENILAKKLNEENQTTKTRREANTEKISLIKYFLHHLKSNPSLTTKNAEEIIGQERENYSLETSRENIRSDKIFIKRRLNILNKILSWAHDLIDEPKR